MPALHTFKILPPHIYVFMYKRHRINAILLHQRVRRSTNAVNIKFFFEQSVYCAVEVEGKARWPRDPEFVVYIKTTGTFQKERDF